MFPMFIPVPVGESTSLEERVSRLEHALALSLDALQTLVDRLAARFGREFLGTDLQHLATVGTDAELHSVVDSIDHLVREDQPPAAARHFREAFGVTWDQA